MINAITEAVSITLNDEFGGGCTIYTEAVEQGLKEPCFFVLCPNPTNRLFLGKRYFRKNQFCIQYIPRDRNRAKEECHAVAERLFQCLKLLPVMDKSVRGTEMRYEAVDGILNFFVNYDLFVYRASEPIPVMEEAFYDMFPKG